MNVFAVFVLCFFFSGATALIYEVVWVRVLALTFGSTVYAIGIVLTAFMGGLSLGSYLFGRWADRGVRNLLRSYAALEFGIAFFAALSPELLDLVTRLYLRLYGSAFTGSLFGLRLVLSIAALLIPTTLMGGTLPVLSRYFIRSEEQLEKRLGLLYALNTIGGMIGTCIVGFILIRTFGLNLTLRSTALVNVAIGLIAIYYSRSYGTEAAAAPQAETAAPRSCPPGYRLALAAFFLSGFSAMLYEVAWSRILVGAIGSSTYSFSLILMGFLLGIGLGSLAVSFMAGRKRLDMFHFSMIEILIGVSGFLTIIFFNVLPPMVHGVLQMSGLSYKGIMSMEFLLVALYIIVPTSLFGATFPVIAGVYNSGEGSRGENIGNIYASNTLGAIFGSAAGAFFLLPQLGSTLSIKAAVAINIAVGLAGLAVLGRKKLAVVFAALLALPFVPANIPPQMLDSGVAIYGRFKEFSLKDRQDEYLYFREGLNATISVSRDETGNVALRTNGKVDASTGRDMSTQLGLSYFPLLLHPEPGDVLIIGLGSGVSMGAAKDFSPDINVECVEIEPAVLEAAKYFSRVNGDILNDPSVKCYTDDARSRLAVSEKKYDIIVSEPSNPWISGIGNLFSKEFYELAHSRLKEGGLFSQWVHVYSLRPADLNMIVNTFVSVFPDLYVIQTSPSDLLLLGAKDGLPALSEKGIAERLRGKVASRMKAYLEVTDPLDVVSYIATDGSGAAEMAKGAAFNTDDVPLLEFSAPSSLYTDTINENLAMLYRHMRAPDLSDFEYGKGDIQAELLFRKSRNYYAMKIYQDLGWIKRARAADASDPDYMVHEAAINLQIRGDEAAARLVRDMALRYPGHARANFELAMLLARADREKADPYFERAAALEPDNFGYVFEAARNKYEIGRYDEALKYYTAALELPHRLLAGREVLQNIGFCHLRLGNMEEGEKFMEKADSITLANK